MARYNAVNANAQQVAQTPFQKYSNDPNAFVAPINEQQTAGINATNQYAGAAQPAIAGGEALTLAGAGPVNPTAIDQGVINQYSNPYTHMVTEQMSQLMNQQNQTAQSGQLGNAIKSNAFGGDRSGIAAANLYGQQSLAYGSTIAPILQQSYNSALGAAQQQQGVGLAAGQANATRLSQAGAQLAGLGQAGQTAGLAGAQAQTAAGTLQQQTDQAGRTAMYNQFLQQQSYPFQTAQFLANIAEGTGALSGQTTNTTSPAPFFSDRRLKENIKEVGKAKNGLPIYSFNYKGDPEKISRLGFMADEVEKKHPEAVGLAGGFKTVDYEQAARPKRYAGGLIAESDEGRGFDAGGAASPSDWTSLLAAHAGGYGPQAGGLYGATGAPGAIPGGGKSYVPAANLPQHQMLQPGHVPAAVQSPVSQLAQIGDQIQSFDKMREGASKAATGAQDWWKKRNEPLDIHANPAAPPAAGPPPAQPTVDPDAKTPSADGAVYARGGLADGGDPEGLYHAPGGLDIPNESPKAQLPKVDSPSGSNSPSALSQLGGLAGTANGLMNLGSAASGGISSIASLLPLLALKDGGAVDGGLTGDNFEFARGGLADGGDPSALEDPTLASDRYDAARQFSGGLDPKAEVAAAHHLQDAVPAEPKYVEPPKGLTGLRAAGKDLAAQGYFDPAVNPERTNFGGLPDKIPDMPADASALRAPTTEAPDVPLPPRRPEGLVPPAEAPHPAAATAPRPGLAAPEEPNPVVRAGNAVSAGLTGAVEGAGRAVQSGIHAILGHEEGFRSQPYQDGKGGPLAIGYGSHTIIDANGNSRPVQPGDRLSQPQATQQMDARLHNEFIPQAKKDIGAAWNSLSQRAQDGIASVTWNYGHVPGSVAAAAQSGDDRQIAAAIAALPANHQRRQREAAYVLGKDVYGAGAGGSGGVDPRAYQANAAPGGGYGGGSAPPSAAPSGLAGAGASLDSFGKTLTDAGQGAGKWFGDNRSWMVPLLTGLGTMASSNSRYLGSAMLQGMGGGAQAYAQEGLNKAHQTIEEQHGLQETAKTPLAGAEMEAKVQQLLATNKLTAAQAAAVRAKLIHLFVLPDGSTSVLDMGTGHRTLIPGDAANATVGPNITGEPVLKAPAAAPAAAPATAPATAPAAAAGFSWKPTTDLPADYKPLLNPMVNAPVEAGGDPLRAAPAARRADEQISAATQAAKNAADQKQLLAGMDTAVGALPTSGILQPGEKADARLSFAKGLQAAVEGMSGGKLHLFDPAQLAAGEELSKDTYRMGAQLSNSMPGPHAGHIISGAMGATPGINNTRAGYERLSASVKEVANAAQDRAAFYNNFLHRFGNLEGAEAEFDRVNPPDMYAKRAVFNSVHPADRDALLASAGDPKKLARAERAIDTRYGHGAAAIVLGR